MRIKEKPHHKDILDAAQASLYWYRTQRNMWEYSQKRGSIPKAIEVTREQLYKLKLHAAASRDGTYQEDHCNGQLRRKLFGIPVHVIGGRPRSQSRGMTAPTRSVRRYSKIQAGSL